MPQLLEIDEVFLRTGDYSDPFVHAFSRKVIRQPLDTYVKSLENCKTKNYAGNIHISWSDFLKMVGKTPFGSTANFADPRLWLGPASFTPLHVDAVDNFVFLVFGLKRFLLFPPEDISRLKMFTPWPERLPDAHVSRIDLREAGALEDLQSQNGVIPIELILRPNDVLYLPKGWSHSVEALETTFMLNLWFSDQNLK